MSKNSPLDELSISELKQRLEENNKKVNDGILIMATGVFIIVFTIFFQKTIFQIVAWAIVFYGLSNILNGHSLVSMYKKIIVKKFLPENITCNYCGEDLDLDDEERETGSYFCPECNKSRNYYDYK